MSLNLEGVGNPICVIMPKDEKANGKKAIPIVYLSENDKDIVNPLPSLTLRGRDDVYFQLIPNPNIERQILYITGQSGSGKSYFTKKYCQEFAKLFPKRPIYMFSSINADGSVDDIKNLKRIKIKSDEFLDEDFTIEDFKNSLVIFDDCDCIPDKKLRNKVNGIFGMIAETGRHQNVYCIYTSHIATAGNDTKRILNESHSITFFPKTMGGRTLKYLCEGYLGMTKDEIDMLKKLPSRAITILKSYPKAIITENDIILTSVC